MKVRFRNSKDATNGGTWLGSAAGEVYDRTTRRSFISKVGAALVTAGVAPLVLQEQASADAPGCCTGPPCEMFSGKDAQFSCKGLKPGQCPAGTHPNNYVWTCCAGGQTGRTMICTDCIVDVGFPGNLCVCTTVTNDNCGKTMTELAQQHSVLQRSSN